MGATWNPDLIRRVGVALAEETLARGCDVLLGPCVNIVRHPLGGRNFETYSEDPCLAGEIGVAWVDGLQSRGVGASLKHFACNNQESCRDRASVVVDERTLREIYLPQFEAIVKRAKPWTVMAAYNRINGVYGSENRHLLTGILREEWGFDGVVMSDWGGTHTTVDALRGGLDLEMPGPAKFFGDFLIEAFNNWQIEHEVVDEAARRMLRLLARVGKIGASRRAAGVANTPAHQALARTVAEESIVLLKNEGGLLPLDAAALRSVAVIGPAAAAAPMCGGSSKNSTPYRTAPLEQLREALGGRVRVEHEAGVENIHEVVPAKAGWVTPLEGAGNGWTADYFDNLEWTGKPAERRIEQKVHFWRPPGNAPCAGVKWDQYSARWTGTLTVPHTGRYRIVMACGACSMLRLLADGRLLGAYAPGKGAAILPGFTGSGFKVELDLVAGRSYRMCVEYVKLPAKEAAYGQMMFIPLAPAGYEAGVQRAAELAARCDVALVFAGLPEDFETEGCDRPHMDLTGPQKELIRAVALANPRTVVVLNCGAPVVMPWLDTVPAVVAAWYPNQEGGRAIARVLLGAAEPGGRLPVTFPRRLEDTPAFGHYPGEREMSYGEGIFVGYRHYDQRAIEPLFPFGFGLSYTQFAYGGLRVPRTLGAGQRLKVSLSLRNTGRRAGAEVVQLYVADPQASLPRPPRELKAFRKVFLKPGETRRIEFALNARDFSFYDPARKSWVMEPGTFEILIGKSSRDICLRKSFEVA
jgi:beta-glucosidase